MLEHPVLTATRRCGQNEADVTRARQTGAALEEVLEQALAIQDATTMSQALLTARVRQFETLVQPYLANCSVHPLPAWVDTQRRALHRHAAELFGAQAAMAIAPDLAHQPLLMPGAGAGPPSMFGR